MLAIDSVEFAQDLRQVQSGYEAQSLELGPDGRYLEGQTAEAVPVPAVKRGLIAALSLPIRLVKFLV